MEAHLAATIDTPKTPKMIARAGKAIWDTQTVGMHDPDDLAYWAIKATQRPSKEMISAGVASTGGVLTDEQVKHVWRAMLKAALGE